MWRKSKQVLTIVLAVSVGCIHGGVGTNVTNVTNVAAAPSGGTSGSAASANVSASVSVTLANPSAPRLANLADIPAAAGVRVDANAIIAALDGQGQWSSNPQYGDIWIPTGVRTDFVPYGTDGQWRPTDAGWYWQSSLPWGWLTFHYGRWVTVGGVWAWVPGRMFAPAWVAWRHGGGWAGWAPLPPIGATLSAPYAYCPWGALAGDGLWGRTLYGGSGAYLYGSTRPVPPAMGVGGAVYAWGPPASPGTAAVAVPVDDAWRHETRVAVPSSTPVAVPSGSRFAIPSGTRVAVPTGGVLARAEPVAPSSAPTAGIRLAPTPAAALPSAPIPLPTRTGAIDPATGANVMTARGYSVPDRLIVESPSYAPRLRETISLGTTSPDIPEVVRLPPSLYGRGATGSWGVGAPVVSFVPSAPSAPTAQFVPVAPSPPAWNSPPVVTGGVWYPSYAPPVTRSWTPPSAIPTPSYPSGGGGGYQPTYAFPTGGYANAPAAPTPAYAPPMALPTPAAPVARPPVAWASPVAGGVHFGPR